MASGRENILWPGLNTPAIKNSMINRISQAPVTQERDDKMQRLREQPMKPKRTAPPPLIRGWTGARMGGRSIGAPDPVGDCELF